MKQLLLRKGKILIEDVPAPALSPKSVLVEVTKSLISTGTEIASMQLSGSSILTKAKERPQEVLKVFHSIKVRGVAKTLALVQGKLDEWKALGYSCTGTVLACGSDVKNFKPGQRVACAGAGIANHAEVVSVPSNLCVAVPSGVADRSAAFVTVGAIALQGVRRADVRLGETVCVIGLGLIGQITVQLLTSAGCRVVGMDLDPKRVERAKAAGMKAGGRYEDIQADLKALTCGMGADATIITASTPSSEPAHQAFELTRKKGRIVVVGAVGMDLKRSPFYEKEQDFVISCSYGPGRYDAAYEQEGIDYPYAYVRWTENRNMSSFLELIADGKFRVEDLVEQEFDIADATRAYDILSQDGPKPLAVILNFPPQPGLSKTISIKTTTAKRNGTGKIRVGLIGVGNFAKSMHVPNLQAMKDRVEIAGVCSANSATALTAARQLGATVTATDYRELINSPDIDALVVSTRHDTHAAIAQEALRAGKHIYLEKPLALEMEELEALEKQVAALTTVPVFMVGFNRRFAPATQNLIKALDGRRAPLVALFRVNAGDLPSSHWTKAREGGGRLRGEACHMVDFFQAIVKSPMRAASISAAGNAATARPDENFSAQFEFEDGSLATLIYTSIGGAALPKEYAEVHWAGRSAVLDDFKTLTFHGGGSNFSSSQDKGHANALDVFFTSIQKGVSFPVPWDELASTTRATIELDREIRGQTN